MSLPDVLTFEKAGLEAWPGHPHYDEVRGLLATFRRTCGELRERVATYNNDTTPPATTERVITYFGQNVLNGALDPNDDDAQ